MSDPLDIQSLLQTGYFTTSRAKSARSTSPLPPSPPTPEFVPETRSYDYYIPQQFDRSPSYSPPALVPPPRPTVEDEVVSLAKEHGSPPPAEFPDEQPHSRGDVDQQPAIMEVHEFNPERRFVLLADGSKPPEDFAQEDTVTNEQSRRTTTSTDSRAPRKKSRRASTNFPENSPRLEEPVPKLERRKSRQDLPRLETEPRRDQASAGHHRSQSFANGTKPDYFSSAVNSRQFGDQLLSPDVIVNGSTGRDRTYYGHGLAQTAGPRSPTQRYQFPDERGNRDKSNRRSSTSNSARRSTSHVDPDNRRRPISNDRDSRRRDEQVRRGYVRDDSRSYGRGESDGIKLPTPSRSRDASRSYEEYARGPQSSGLSSRVSMSVQDDRASVHGTDRGSDGGRSEAPRSRVSKSPLPSPKLPEFASETTNPRKGSATFSVSDKGTPTPERQTSTLPYPEDHDDSMMRPDAIGSREESVISPFWTAPAAMMPYMPTNANHSEQPLEVETKVTSPLMSPPGSSQPWQPPKFDPDNNGCGIDRPVGSYRRYSESVGQDGPQQLPECPRTKPVAGMVDWLTLHRTNFNICPDCYHAVFAKSAYRTQFQPMLRPSDEAIACDFGSSPWYRIAWLLTLKHDLTDLRMFHQIADAKTTCRDQLCPGDKKASREWLTVRDPYTRKAALNFTICLQCAKTVMALLPTLSGAFVPLDSRTEPMRGVCALHFKPQRQQFVLYFDAMETASDQAVTNDKSLDLADLTKRIERLSVENATASALARRECSEDNPVPDVHWHTMQYLPEFTVCGECFDQVVRPKLDNEGVIPRNFYAKPEKLPWATCQLYSTRMRDVFKKACRYDDPKYLEDKVLERIKIEADIRSKLMKLDREGRSDARTERQVEELIQKWKRWE